MDSVLPGLGASSKSKMISYESTTGFKNRFRVGHGFSHAAHGRKKNRASAPEEHPFRRDKVFLKPVLHRSLRAGFSPEMNPC